VNVEDVRIAVGELASLLRADGGDLVLVTADPAIDRVEVRVELDDVSCVDCILPPEQLRTVIEAGIGRRVTSEFELVVHDPRDA
jgi:hypothetical protein